MKFLKDIYFHYTGSNTFEKGAALSYYTFFSFMPILMLFSAALGLIFKEEIISGEMYSFLQNLVGDAGADQFVEILKKQHLFQKSILTSIIWIATLLLSATGMFNQIHMSLNAIWGLKVKAEKSIFNYFARHFSSFFVLLLLCVLIFLSTISNTLFTRYSDTMTDILRNANIYEHLISFVLITMLFTILYKIMGNAVVPWITALVSAGFTTVLFFVGKIAIGAYIAHSSTYSIFGTASALAALLIWVYYTSQILFIGASFAYVFGQRTGHEIRPTSQVVRFIHKELE